MERKQRNKVLIMTDQYNIEAWNDGIIKSYSQILGLSSGNMTSKKLVIGRFICLLLKPFYDYSDVWKVSIEIQVHEYSFY